MFADRLQYSIPLLTGTGKYAQHRLDILCRVGQYRIKANELQTLKLLYFYRQFDALVEISIVSLVWL